MDDCTPAAGREPMAPAIGASGYALRLQVIKTKIVKNESKDHLELDLTGYLHETGVTQKWYRHRTASWDFLRWVIFSFPAWELDSSGKLSASK
jgi:hypothetical protein